MPKQINALLLHFRRLVPLIDIPEILNIKCFNIKLEKNKLQLKQILFHKRNPSYSLENLSSISNENLQHFL